ncbi:hypothetical protein NQ317_000077 [Molorchus minor]|uniref:Myeloid differentiation primary response protein MyD88 n=1 Tax=Molorchus minor TaxID=1323400 RepID=A0ABQ9IZ78_9CUCU|nr:hypothetical protein NQ317_000077 [Molorchus minor]
MEQEASDTDGLHDNGRHVTVRALRKKTRKVISTLLNPPKIIPNEKGYHGSIYPSTVSDWHGLAEMCGISGEKIPSLQQDPDPSNKVINLWTELDNNKSTIHNLILYLEELDRFDIIEDIESLIEDDINFFKNNPNGFRGKPLNLDADRYILTMDDVDRADKGLEPQTYDAFVLFAEDDIDFATLLVETMEKDYNLKFCVKDRDLVGGGFEHDSIIKLISERCGRLIVIVSAAFLDSPANKFFYSFAQAIGIEQRQRKIVPCVYSRCNNTLPPELACYYILDYTRSGEFYNFWKKLHDSIRIPTAPNNNFISSTSCPQHNSASKQCLSKMRSENITESSLKPINQVKFNSMVDLNKCETEKILPDENLTNSSSANSLGNYTSTIKKQKSIYNRLKSIIKPKPTKSSDLKVEVPKMTAVEQSEVEKEKKRTFFSRGSKRKKAALAS